jgi:radical SAM superfamily enzyme YgiQ (UPF0313 family)
MSQRPGPRSTPIIKLPVLNPRCSPEERPPWLQSPPVSSHKRCLWIAAEASFRGMPSTPPPALPRWKTSLRQFKSLSMPLGLMTAINYFPQSWEHRLIDERIGTPVCEQDLAWADIVLLSGMYIEARRANEIATHARRWGAISVIGGPGVILNPDLAASFDIVHIGDLGDRTYELVQWLDANGHPPPWQIRFQTDDIIPMDLQPLPALEKIDARHYTSAMLQFQKGCPFLCEFCDIIEIFGRVPQSKSPERYLRELDLLYDTGWRGRVTCVADNFHANPKIAREMLRAIAGWQQRHGYPFQFDTAATLDVADREELLCLYRDAGFRVLGIGIESSEEDTLLHIHKKQNTRHPVAESIRKINAHGIEVAGSLILGFDTDTRASGAAQVAFVERANIVLIGITMLTALKGTQLYRRMEQEGRLRPEWPYMHYKLGQDVVQQMFNETVEGLYEPRSMLRRLSYQVEHVRPKQRVASRTGLAFAWQSLGAEVSRRLGRPARMTLDSRGRPAPVQPPAFRLPEHLMGGLLAMWKLGVVWKDRTHYWKYIRACARQRDLQSALLSPMAVARLIDAVRANRNESSEPQHRVAENAPGEGKLPASLEQSSLARTP